MARIDLDAEHNYLHIKANGSYRVHWKNIVYQSINTLHFEWKKGTPAGTLILSVDGDLGINNVVNLTTERVRNFVGKPVFIDMDFAGLPDDCDLVIHFY